METATQNLQAPPQSDPRKARGATGFAKVVAGGRIIRVDSNKPYLERMVTGSPDTDSAPADYSSNGARYEVLKTVVCNLQAGVRFVDDQEAALFKVGECLAAISTALSRVHNSNGDEIECFEAQKSCELAQRTLCELSHSSYDQSALFSSGPSKPVVIAVPASGRWEGLSVNKCDLARPGLKAVQSGKVFGDGRGYFLDHATIKRAFGDWQDLCIQNGMQWGHLLERLRWTRLSLDKLDRGVTWEMPAFPQNPKSGPLLRPNLQN